MPLAAALILTFATAQPILEGELIFPGTPKHDHGSSVVQLADDSLLAVWFHGSGERTADDVLLQGARKAPGATAWSEPFLMADTPGLPDCNPVLFVDPRGVLWLFWITVQDNQWGGSLLKYRTAEQPVGDGPPEWDWQAVIHIRPGELEEQFLAVLERGETELAPLLALRPELTEEVARGKAAAQDKLRRRLGWMTRIHPIMTGSTRMLLGLYSDVFNCGLVAITEDWGDTWEFSEPILDPNPMLLGNIQTSLVQRKKGEIVAYMRDNGMPKCVRTSVSSDDGITWSELDKLPIRNPGSSVECIALASGAWVLVCNDAVDGRHRLAAYLSDDEGATWPLYRLIEEAEPGKGSFSYPSVIQTRDGSIHCTYSHRREGDAGSSIKHVRFNEAWVRAGQNSGF